MYIINTYFVQSCFLRTSKMFSEDQLQHGTKRYTASTNKQLYIIMTFFKSSRNIIYMIYTNTENCIIEPFYYCFINLFTSYYPHEGLLS